MEYRTHPRANGFFTRRCGARPAAFYFAIPDSKVRDMWYAIIGSDVPDSLPLRKPNRPAHLARVEALRDAGRLLLAGPFPAIDSPDPGPAGFAGTLIVAEFADLSAARAWAEADVYRTAGVWASLEVRPFLKVLP